jgi:hypothetical protein
LTFSVTGYPEPTPADNIEAILSPHPDIFLIIFISLISIKRESTKEHPEKLGYPESSSLFFSSSILTAIVGHFCLK